MGQNNIEVISDPEYTKKKLREAGITPGKIQNSVTKRDSSGRITKTTYTGGRATRVVVKEPVSKEGKKYVKTTVKTADITKNNNPTRTAASTPTKPDVVSSSVNAQGELIVGEHTGSVSRQLSGYETAGFEASHGGQSVEASNQKNYIPPSSPPGEDEYFVVKGKYGSSQNERYSKLEFEDGNTNRNKMDSGNNDNRINIPGEMGVNSPAQTVANAARYARNKASEEEKQRQILRAIYDTGGKTEAGKLLNIITFQNKAAAAAGYKIAGKSFKENILEPAAQSFSTAWMQSNYAQEAADITNAQFEEEYGFNPAGSLKLSKEQAARYNTLQAENENRILLREGIYNPDEFNFQASIGRAGIATAIGASEMVIIKPLVGDVLSAAFAGKAAREIVKNPTPETIGEYGLDIAAGIPFVAKAGKYAYVATGSKYVPEELVFSEQVLVEGKQFPLAKSSDDIVKAFENTRDAQGNIYAVHASPKKIGGEVVGAGPKAKANLEDPGLYVTPKGEASPAFLGVNGEGYGEVTLNPLRLFDVPTITEFKATGIRRPPASVLKEPGFEAVRDWQAELAGSGDIAVTKRSILGQGELNPQEFIVMEDVSTPGGINAKKGDIKIEKGTTEMEAVVPETQMFEYVPETTIGKIKGFDYYTFYKGEPVALRKTDLVVDELKVSNEPISHDSVILTKEQILSEQKPVTRTPSSGTAPASEFLSPTISVSEISLDESVAPSSSSSSNGSEILIDSSLSTPTSASESTSPLTSTSTTSSTLSAPSSSSFSESIISSSSSITSSSSYSDTSFFESVSSSSSSSSSSRSQSTRSLLYDEEIIIPGKKHKKKKNNSLFEAYVRRRGEFRLLGSFESEEQAVKAAKNKVGSTAAASFRIFEDGELLNINPGSKYRKSKTEKGTIVELDEFRINTAGEFEQITRAPRKKRRGKRR